MAADIWEQLRAPFPADDIEWRVQQSGVKKGNGWAMVLAYVTNRAIMQRLDDVLDPDNWKNEFATAPDGGVMCGISIFRAGEWITKYDGAENTQVEAVKGGLSGAMKRAAVQWGIGRYLYQLESNYVPVLAEKGANYIAIKYKDGNQEKRLVGYWNPPKLPDWALPAPEPVKNETPGNQTITPPEPTITSDQIQELMSIAKKKGAADKNAAIAFLNSVAKGTFTNLPQSQFEAYKKQVITEGWGPKESVNP